MSDRWEQVLGIMHELADEYERVREIDTSSPAFDQEMSEIRANYAEVGIDLTNVATLSAMILLLQATRESFVMVTQMCPATAVDPEGAMHAVGHLNTVSYQFFSAFRYFWVLNEGPDFEFPDDLEA